MIPDFQTLMLPFLKYAADKAEHTTREVREYLARYFRLSEEELQQYFPSRRASIFNNRVAWAKAYLKMAGFIENTQRGHFKITSAGLEVLRTNPEKIDLKFLSQYPGFKSYLSRVPASADAVEMAQTPEEVLEDTYKQLRKTLAAEVLSLVKSCSPAFFERLVLDLMLKMGYGGAMGSESKISGRPGDEGIDGVIREDRLGLDLIYLQAKRWNTPVGRPEIQKFVGALAGHGVKKGVFITTSFFTQEAKDYLPKTDVRVVLVDGEQLAELMIDFDLGVATRKTIPLKSVDSDYFSED